MWRMVLGSLDQEISTLYQFPSTSNENFFKVTGAECFAFFFIPVTLNES